jgi:hypothetical protein
MGRQYNKVIKRKRRDNHIRRKKDAANAKKSPVPAAPTA